MRSRDLENIDYGNCIPDCGVCCKMAKPSLLDGEAEKIAKNLNTSLSEIYDAGARTFKFIEGGCIFLSNYSICRTHSIKPYVCSRFPNTPIQCQDYWMIVSLETIGIDIKSELKKKFLESVDSGFYDKEKWLLTARNYLDQKFETNSKTLENYLKEKYRKRV